MRQQIKQKLSEILDKAEKDRKLYERATRSKTIVIDCDQFVTCRFCQAYTQVNSCCDRCGRRQ